MYFGLLLATGVFFIFIAFAVFLAVIVIVPQKFALCFTVGCGFIIGSFFMLKGPKNQFLHMTSTERLPFTLGFIDSMVGTIYVSMVLHSYILSVFFAVIQVLALAYYCISYFPGGAIGKKFLTSSLTSSRLCEEAEATKHLKSFCMHAAQVPKKNASEVSHKQHKYSKCEIFRSQDQYIPKPKTKSSEASETKSSEAQILKTDFFRRFLTTCFI